MQFSLNYNNHVLLYLSWKQYWQNNGYEFTLSTTTFEDYRSFVSRNQSFGNIFCSDYQKENIFQAQKTFSSLCIILIINVENDTKSWKDKVLGNLYPRAG